MAHGHGHKRDCKCGFCRKSSAHTNHGRRKKTARKRPKRRSR